MDNFTPELKSPSNKFESHKILILKEDVEKLKSELSNIDESKLTPEQKSRLSDVKDRIIKISKGVLKTTRWLALTGALLAVANHERTRYKVEVITESHIESNDTRTYKHEDARTTHLLNILAGREKFTEEDLRYDYEAFIEEYIYNYNIQTTKNIREMSIEEIDEILFENGEKMGYLLKKGELVELFKNELKDLNLKLEESNKEISAEAYDLVWQMEQECGNPVIRFRNENKFLGKYRTEAYQFAAQEDPLNNRIYVDPDDLIASRSTIVRAELSHLKHYNDDPVGVSLNYLINFAKVIKEGGLDDKKLSSAYSKLYKTPGTFEHTAHEVIEPYLKTKYNLFSKKN